jgi:hypothetical protein
LCSAIVLQSRSKDILAVIGFHADESYKDRCLARLVVVPGVSGPGLVYHPALVIER